MGGPNQPRSAAEPTDRASINYIHILNYIHIFNYIHRYIKIAPSKVGSGSRSGLHRSGRNRPSFLPNVMNVMTVGSHPMALSLKATAGTYIHSSCRGRNRQIVHDGSSGSR